MAHDHPEFVSRLLLSGPPLLTTAQIATLQTTLPVTDLDENGRFLTDLWQRLHKKGPTLQLDLILRETIAALQCRDSYHEAYFAVFAQDLGGQLAALRCPVLLLAGEQDSLIASLEPAAQLVRNGRLLRIPGAGTYLCDQQPRLVANLVREFLGEA
jgi:pimeloyl-ACP methyl ester carboxylesterase